MTNLSESDQNGMYYAYQKYLDSRHPMSKKLDYSQWLRYEDLKFKAVEKKWEDKNE